MNCTTRTRKHTTQCVGFRTNMENTNKSLKEYEGNVEITVGNSKEWEKKLRYTEKISGSVYVRENAKASFPKLESVSGYVDVRENAKASFPKLESVSGSVDVGENAKASFPNLKSSGYVYVRENAKASFPNLKSSGYVDVRENAKASFPNLKSSGSVYVRENAKASFPNLKSSGSVDVGENAKASFPKLESVSGYVDVRENEKLEKQLWKIASKNQWYISDKSSDWLLSQKGNFIFRINDVNFREDLFDRVRKNELSASEVFAIENTEQRRVAYERMDKMKMKELPDLKTEDEVKDDGYGYPMKIISFKSDKFDTPFYFLNCFDASTGREYFVETREKKCWAAKMDSFGLKEDEKFDEEW